MYHSIMLNDNIRRNHAIMVTRLKTKYFSFNLYLLTRCLTVLRLASVFFILRGIMTSLRHHSIGLLSGLGYSFSHFVLFYEMM